MAHAECIALQAERFVVYIFQNWEKKLLIDMNALVEELDPGILAVLFQNGCLLRMLINLHVSQPLLEMFSVFSLHIM